MPRSLRDSGLAALCCLPLLASAEVLSSSDTHFELRVEARSSLPPAAVWGRLVDPASWWHPGHTYSGDASNLSLMLEPGGLWREDQDGGSVAHGEVLCVRTGKTLRMNAPFGPLRAAGAHAVWTISIEADGEGSRVIFDEIVNGPPTANLAQLAEAVHAVKTEAIGRLAAAESASGS